MEKTSGVIKESACLTVEVIAVAKGWRRVIQNVTIILAVPTS